MDTSQILSIFLKGALGSRGRKRARKAARFLGGRSGFLTASTVLGAAGVAWGIYESMQNKGVDATPTSAPPSTGFGSSSATPPPVPGSAARASDFPADVLRVIRLAVSAARADGSLLPAERALILSHAREAGVESIVDDELAAPRPLNEIVAGVSDTQAKRDLYILAFTIVRADDTVSGAERVYLAQLAHQLGLDAGLTAQLETETAASIDAQSDAAAPPP